MFMEYAKGKLVAIGGAEDKGTDSETVKILQSNLNFSELGILRKIVEEVGGKAKRIEVITTASMIPEEVGDYYINAFNKIGCSNIGLMHIRNRIDVANTDYIERLKTCDALMFTGGNQLRLTTTFGGTEFLQIVLERYRTEEAFLVAGTSAGAMAMSNTMIYEGNASKAHLKGEVKITTGLGFMDDVIFDSHFEKRGRFGRLAQAVSSNPSCIGIGLGEDTGVLISDGKTMEAIGSGLVVVLDGHEIKHSNIADIPDGCPISIENMKVHFLEKGNGYNPFDRIFIPEVYEGAVSNNKVAVE